MRPTSSHAATTNSDAPFWNRIARKYAESPIEDCAGYERTLARVTAMLRPHDHVLEVGCGTGTTALRLAPLVQSYHATDLAPEMIAIAMEKQAREAIEGLTLGVATAADAPPHAQGYDAVLAFNVLHLVENLDETLQQIYALLRPGGRLIAKTALVAELSFWVRGGLPIARLLGKAPRHVQVFNEETLVRSIVSAGFRIEAVERHGTIASDIRSFTVGVRPLADDALR